MASQWFYQVTGNPLWHTSSPRYATHVAYSPSTILGGLTKRGCRGKTHGGNEQITLERRVMRSILFLVAALFCGQAAGIIDAERRPYGILW